MKNVQELIRQLDAQVDRGESFEVVLESAVRGTHQLDPRFDWTGVYELYPDNVLRLGPFVVCDAPLCNDCARRAETGRFFG